MMFNYDTRIMKRNCSSCTSFALLASLLIAPEICPYSDYEALRYLNSQKRLNPRHGHSIEYLQAYCFILKHKKGIEKAANTLIHHEDQGHRF